MPLKNVLVPEADRVRPRRRREPGSWEMASWLFPLPSVTNSPRGWHISALVPGVMCDPSAAGGVRSVTSSCTEMQPSRDSPFLFGNTFSTRKRHPIPKLTRLLSVGAPRRLHPEDGMQKGQTTQGKLRSFGEAANRACRGGGQEKENSTDDRGRVHPGSHIFPFVAASAPAMLLQLSPGLVSSPSSSPSHPDAPCFCYYSEQPPVHRLRRHGTFLTLSLLLVSCCLSGANSNTSFTKEKRKKKGQKPPALSL